VNKKERGSPDLYVIRAFNHATLHCETTIGSFIKDELKKLIANERPIVVQGWSETESLIREQGRGSSGLYVIRAHNFATLYCETTKGSFIKDELKKLIANERPIVVQGWSETESLKR